VIVRIMGEGQYELDGPAVTRLEDLDATLSRALADQDEVAFEKALEAVLAEIRSSGRPLEPTTIVPSDLALPTEGSSLDEVRALLDQESSETA